MKKLKIDLSLGDSSEVLKDFEANSIDVLVTDPPYGLGEEPDPIDLLRAWIHEGHHSGSGRGFMGKCLHPKTEVLTSKGWKFIGEVRIGDLLFSLNPDTHNAEFVPVSRTFEYDYEGTLSVIESLHTKQVVTPNHRVYIQSENDWDFCEANKLPSTFSVKNKNHVESLDQKAHVKKIVYSGKVYCCELQKNHIFLSKFDDKSVWTGNSWDAMVPGPALWKEVLRVLKPGAKGGVFAGTRTLHLMMASLRIAGFDIETVWSWTYGCYSADTEILTPTGWKSGLEVQKGEKVAAWDSETEEIRFVPVQHKVLAPFSGDMIHFKNDNTDQLLTPNHRVYAKHRHRKQVDGIRRSFFDEKWEVKEAGDINRWNTIDLPLSGYHDGPGIGGEDLASLLGWVWTEGGYDLSGTGVRIYQSDTNQEHVERIIELLDRLEIDHKKYSRKRFYKDRIYTEHTWFMSGEPALKIREMLSDKKPTWELLWKMTQKEKEAFFKAAMDGDGSWDHLAFYQKDHEDLEKMQTLVHLMGMQGRVNKNKDCVAVHFNHKTQLQNRHLKANHKQKYEGDVWCVKVETGAVMVRRNGRIFISGNSGFPKSHNVYKALKKKLAKDSRYGEEGELRCECVGEDYVYDDSLFDPEAGPDRDRNQDRKIILDEYEDHDLTCRVCSWCLLPDDQYVESLDGLGTALKPAWEPVIVVQKPETNSKVDLEGILESYGFEPDEIELIMTPPEEDED